MAGLILPDDADLLVSDDEELERGRRIFDQCQGYDPPPPSALAAYHEAGHLAAAWAQRAYLIGGTIEPHGRFAGAVSIWLEAGLCASPENVIVSYAGPAAARRFDPTGRDDGGKLDRQDAERMLRSMCRSPGAIRIVRRHCEDAAERLVESNWDLIEAFAQALLDHLRLGAEELHAIVEDVVHRRNRRDWAEIAHRSAAAPSFFIPHRRDGAMPRVGRVGPMPTAESDPDEIVHENGDETEG